MEDPAMAMPSGEEGPWGHSDIFSEPTDPEMIEYLGRKRESLQNQVGVTQQPGIPCTLGWVGAVIWVFISGGST